jgi:hypothetical protein
MTNLKRLPAFEKFIQGLRAAWAELPDVEARMKKGQRLLEELVNDQSLREASKTWPSTEGRKNLLFYEDPDYGFAINAACACQAAKAAFMITLIRGPLTGYSMEQKASSVTGALTIFRKKVTPSWNWKASPKGNRERSIWCRRLTRTPNRVAPRARSP